MGVLANTYGLLPTVHRLCYVTVTGESLPTWSSEPHPPGPVDGALPLDDGADAGDDVMGADADAYDANDPPAQTDNDTNNAAQLNASKSSEDKANNHNLALKLAC